VVADRFGRPHLRPVGAPTGSSRSSRVAWPVAAGLAAAAASTLTTAGAAAAAGRQADLALQPIELALRVGLLLAAPCAGALLAAIAVPKGGGRWPLAAIVIGVPIGPLLVLRLDRLGQFGVVPALLTAAVLVLWGIAGAMLASSWWRRPARTVDRSALPGGGEVTIGSIGPLHDPDGAAGGGEDPGGPDWDRQGGPGWDPGAGRGGPGAGPGLGGPGWDPGPGGRPDRADRADPTDPTDPRDPPGGLAG
jgi:hypothetical protein